MKIKLQYIPQYMHSVCIMVLSADSYISFKDVSLAMTPVKYLIQPCGLKRPLPIYNKIQDENRASWDMLCMAHQI